MTVKPTGFTQPGIEAKPGFGKTPAAPMLGSVGKFPAPCAQRGIGRMLRDAAWWFCCPTVLGLEAGLGPSRLEERPGALRDPVVIHL